MRRDGRRVLRLIHRDAAHEDELDWCAGLRCSNRLAEPPRGLRDEVARRAEDPLEAEHVTETRDDGVAAANVAQQVLVAQRQQVGLDDLEAGVLRGAFREPVSGPHDGPDADVAAQKLLQNTPAGAPGAADKKYRVLRVHLAASRSDLIVPPIVRPAERVAHHPSLFFVE